MYRKGWNQQEFTRCSKSPGEFLLIPALGVCANHPGFFTISRPDTLPSLFCYKFLLLQNAVLSSGRGIL